MNDLDGFFKNQIYNDFYENIETNSNICMICTLPYNLYDKVTLTCNHTFHESCINEIMKNEHFVSCPYCKSCNAKFKLSSLCKYATKSGKVCEKFTLADHSLCKFHARYMKKHNNCNHIFSNGKNEGKRCKNKACKDKLFCEEHLSTSVTI